MFACDLRVQSDNILTGVFLSIRTCASSLYTATYAQLTEEFHVSQIVATLGLSLFVIGLGESPTTFAYLLLIIIYLPVMRA